MTSRLAFVSFKIGRKGTDKDKHVVIIARTRGAALITRQGKGRQTVVLGGKSLEAQEHLAEGINA